MSELPSHVIPGAEPVQQSTVSARDVDISSTGATDLDFLVADVSEVKEVVVSSTAQDFDFNVTHNGEDVFSSDRSPSSADEVFLPDQNQISGAEDYANITVAVSDAANLASQTADVAVRVQHSGSPGF
jgi:hypothetical protein